MAIKISSYNQYIFKRFNIKIINLYQFKNPNFVNSSFIQYKWVNRAFKCVFRYFFHIYSLFEILWSNNDKYNWLIYFIEYLQIDWYETFLVFILWLVTNQLIPLTLVLTWKIYIYVFVEMWKTFDLLGWLKNIIINKCNSVNILFCSLLMLLRF